MQFDIPGMLRDMGRLVDQMAMLTEWNKLEQSQRRAPFPTSFEISDDLRGEFCNLHATFLTAALQLRELLNRPDLKASPFQRQHWREQLDQLRDRVAALAAGKGL